MLAANNSLIAEVESAISSGSADKRVDTLRKITDLFMLRADSYSDEQVEVFDDVISRLAEKIESQARAELAKRLAPVARAPLAVIRSLARDKSIVVAASGTDPFAAAQRGRVFWRLPRAKARIGCWRSPSA